VFDIWGGAALCAALVFDTKDVVAEIPTRLPAGSYLARYAVYNGEEKKQEGELNLSVLPYGTLEGDTGYGFMGLSIGDKATIVLPILLVLIIAIILIRKSRKKKNT